MKPQTVGRILTQQGRMTQISNFVQPETGLVAGTLILTADGEIPVEYLTPGDRIVSRLRGMVHLRELDIRTVTVDTVRVAPGALGAQKPAHATMMSAGQQVLLRGKRAEAFGKSRQTVAPVGALVDGEGVSDLGPRMLRLVRLSFERPEVIYADGIEVACITEAVQTAIAA